jgi:collagenase-like PrtC family protease
LVLARELTIEQIKAIKAEVKTPLEYFVHGALCVAFSGQCYISHADNGRSANRGDCSQACRLPYPDRWRGRVVAYEKHLLSMKDNDQSRNLEALLNAGVQSLKIEGRYKDMGYVKNITAHYRVLLDEILERRPEFTRALQRCARSLSPRMSIKISIAVTPIILPTAAWIISARLIRRNMSACISVMSRASAPPGLRSKRMNLWRTAMA